MRFKKGQSGNPKGKPPGAKDKRTALREMLVPHSKELVEKAVSMALDGDSSALKLCIDRLMPPLKAIQEKVVLEGIEGTLTEQAQGIINTMAQGVIAPDQATGMLQAIAAMCRIQEIEDLTHRLEAMELALKSRKQ